MAIGLPDTAPFRHPLGPVAPPVGPGADTIDVTRILGTLWRRKLMIAGIGLCLWLPAVAVIKNLTPTYSASAVVVVEPKSNHIIDIASVVERGGVYADTVNTELDVIRSRTLARSVIETLGLTAEPDINPTLPPPPDAGSRLFEAVLARLPAPAANLLAQPREPEPAPNAEILMSRMIDAFLKRLSVGASPQSRAIRISFESTKPELAARVANEVAQAYKAHQVSVKQAATAAAATLLQAQLSDLRGERNEASERTEAYRSEAGLMRGRDGLLVAEELTTASAQLAEAKAALADAQSRLQSISGGTGAEVLNGAVVGALRQQQAALRARIAELRERYGDRHPSINTANAELRNVTASISGEIDRAARGLRTDVARETARVQEASRRLEALRAEAKAAGSADVRLRELNLSAEAADNNYRRAVARLKEMEVLRALSVPDAHVVSAATVPAFPAAPNKALLAGLAGLVASIAAVGAALLREMGQRGFLSTHQAEASTGLPSIGIMPFVKPLGRGTRSLSAGNAALRECMEHVARVGARLRVSGPHEGRDGTPRAGEVLMITSSHATEGKTTFAVALASSLADSGRRVVIVDADTRRPKVHQILGLEGRVGLTDVLSGKAPLDTALMFEPGNLAALPAGEPIEQPQKLLGSPAMTSLLCDLCARFDVVVIDTPPVIAVPDPLLLAPLADRIVYVVEWSRTSEAHVAAGVRQLRDVGGRLAGTVLSKVNLRRHAAYEYGALPRPGYPHLLTNGR